MLSYLPDKSLRFEQLIRISTYMARWLTDAGSVTNIKLFGATMATIL